MVRKRACETVADACERELRRWVVRGVVQPGDRLPAERVLVARLGVNRSTLRNALARLVSARFLRVRQGSGYVVQDVRRVAGVELAADLARDGTGVAAIAVDLLRVRRTLVGLALARASMPDAELVARQATRLREIVDSGASCSELVEMEHEILAALLAAGPTPILALSGNSLFFALRAMPQVCEALCAEPRTLTRFLASLQRCVDAPSAAAARAVERAYATRDAAVIKHLTATSRSPLE